MKRATDELARQALPVLLNIVSRCWTRGWHHGWHHIDPGLSAVASSCGRFTKSAGVWCSMRQTCSRDRLMGRPPRSVKVSMPFRLSRCSTICRVTRVQPPRVAVLHALRRTVQLQDQLLV